MESSNVEGRNKKRKSSAMDEEAASKWFLYKSRMRKADIPKETLTHLRVVSSLRKIPDNAFKDFRALVHLQLPETLKKIGKSAFQNCSSLKSVQFVSNHASSETASIDPDLEDGTIVFPESAVLQIDEHAFQHSGLEKVIICSTSTKLGKEAFCKCWFLKSVDLPEGLQVIERGLFSECVLLTTVKMPSSLIKIGDSAFYVCGRLTYFQLPHGLVEIGAWSFHDCSSLETLHIPSTVSSIERGAFEGCSGLTHITLPPTLETIESDMFKGCRRLSSVDLPHGLLEIKNSSFESCRSIESLNFPSAVSTIGVNAFHYCSGLKRIKLPPRLERIESGVFNECHSLEYIEIPSSVTFIGRTFSGCSSLSHIRIPPSVDSIEEAAFAGCRSLISIELPEGFLFGVSLFRCFSLVNVVGPPHLALFSRHEFIHESKLGSVVDGYDDLVDRLTHRFTDSPLSKLCYYQSYHSSEDAMVQLQSLMGNDPLAATSQVDKFGMTPLHILLLSQTPNEDMLVALMNEGKADHISHGRDSFGSTPMDYLCLNRMPNSSELIRTAVLTRFDQLLGLDRSWKSDMLQAVDEVLGLDWSSRRETIDRVYLKFANYERQEIVTFLLELCLWKRKIDQFTSNGQTADREFCRVNSGASIVIPHVLAFLDKLGLDDQYFSLRDPVSLREDRFVGK